MIKVNVTVRSTVIFTLLQYINGDGVVDPARLCLCQWLLKREHVTMVADIVCLSHS